MSLTIRGRTGVSGVCGICNESIYPHHKIHYDHILPRRVTHADLSDEELVAAARLASALLVVGARGINHPQNVRPVHAECNLRKSERIILPDDCAIDDAQIDDCGIDDVD